MTFRKLVITIVLLLSQSSFACECAFTPLFEKINDFDFIAVVTIKKAYPLTIERRIPSYGHHKIDFNIDRLYKGPSIESMNVSGSTSMCNMTFTIGQQYLIFSRKDSKGLYVTGECLGNFNLNNLKRNKNSLTLDILELLKSKGVDLSNHLTLYMDQPIVDKYYDSLKGTVFDHKVYLFNLTFNSDFELKNVEIINGFNNVINNELISRFKKVKWSSLQNELSEIPENTKMLFGLVFYPSQGERQSFLSRFVL